MTKLDKLQNEALAQSLNDPSLFSNFTKTLQTKFVKVGTAVVFGALALGTTGMAHAMDSDSFQTATGLSGIIGIVSNGGGTQNLPPECANVQGTNGWMIAGGGTAGALAGSNIGRGNGTKLATVLGTVVGMGAANASEQNRIQRECANIIQQKQQQQYQNQYQNQNQYRNYNQNPATPTSDILYQAKMPDGNSYFVTVDNSPGLMAINGNRQGVMDPHSNPTVYSGVKQSLDNLNAAYVNLDQVSKQYIQTINGSEADVFNPNPDLNPYKNQTKLSQLSSQYDQAYNQYARVRGVATHILDEATARNYNLNEFGTASPLFQVPNSAKVTYANVYHQAFQNRFANDIKSGIR